MNTRANQKTTKLTAEIVAKYLIDLNRQACERNSTNSEKEVFEEIEIGMSKLKLQKLLYYCQGYYLALYKKPMFHDEIQAWPHGPVVPKVYKKFKDKAKGHFISPDEAKLTDEERKKIGANEQHLIESVFDLLGHYDAWKLRDKTHEEQPWIKANKKAKDEEKTNVTITHEDMQEYFSRYVKD